jgi:hypothetical protein
VRKSFKTKTIEMYRRERMSLVDPEFSAAVL